MHNYIPKHYIPIVGFSSVGRGLKTKIDVSMHIFWLKSCMPVQMYGETRFVDLQVHIHTILYNVYGWMRVQGIQQ